ncbi:MAG: energy-coupling factor transporter transmembrane protein EcfT [Oscillospiraceae bacterium]|jgi:energy-coupling factor transport system permease protein|nr:energy-coupling factor transporter transmembrane protein EcfT [Oscillospiraceae bacterium]
MAREILSGDGGERGLALDPRTKLLLVFTVSVVLTAGGYGGAMDYARPALAAAPFALLLLSRRWGSAALYSAAYMFLYCAEMFLVPLTYGIVNFFILATCGMFSRFMPGLVMGHFLVTTTTASQFMAAMSRMRVPAKVTVPLSVMFRFFPTVGEECSAINDAMRMRGVSLAGGRPLVMLEYRLVPMMVCGVKIGEELSAAALTRGFGAPVCRTNIRKVGFHAQDAAAILLCLFGIAAYIGWLAR